jgi:4-alpha-glucanotransferase
MNKRGCGVLLHISSLPSPFGIGDFGPEAFSFADFLRNSNQSYWQVLPLNPTHEQRSNSPYSTNSSFAGNSLLISPQLLVKDGLIKEQELDFLSDINPYRASFVKAREFKENILNNAYKNSKKNGFDPMFKLFCEKESEWLEDHALFNSLVLEYNDLPWNKWPSEIRDRHPEALKEISRKLSDSIEKEKFIQFLFTKQWEDLKYYCHSKGIQIIGDLPMYVNHNSADVWAHREIFKLDQELNPAFFAGVPPDRFSRTGQLWYNPVYNWKKLTETRYQWWIERFRRTFDLFDIVRIDHFRGFVAYWEVPSDKHDASGGLWEDVPVDDFFNTIFKQFYCFPVIAEDLGTITSDVKFFKNRLGFPGTKVLLFAFENDDPLHPYLPHTYEQNCMACTGTHDTNTLRGWFEREASDSDRKRLFRYLGQSESPEQINWKMIRLLMMSSANMVIIPLQDILNLGEEARMNNPSASSGNWKWRFTKEMIDNKLTEMFAEMTITYGRS